MSEHRGYRATNEHGGWKGWAWDPATKAYRRKSGFDSKPAALRWAKEEHSRFITRQSYIARSRTAEIAQRYIAWLTDAKGRSESHLKNVKRALAGLADAMPEPSDETAREQAEAWLAKLDVSARTKVQYLVTGKAMFKWALNRKYVADNPLTLAETEDPGDPLKEQFTIDELRKMVLADECTFWFDAVTMIYTGMRRSEPSEVLREQIDISGRVIRVRGKGRGEHRKEGLIPIQDEYLALLLPELDRRPTGPLATLAHKQYSDHLVHFLDVLDIPKRGRSVHSWRHCYAGIMTATGVPSNLLAAYMRHSSQKTTAGYSRLATRYQQVVSGWQRGEFQLLRGACSPIAGPTASTHRAGRAGSRSGLSTGDERP